MMDGAWGISTGIFTGFKTIANHVAAEKQAGALGLLRGFKKGVASVAANAAEATESFLSGAATGVTDKWTGKDKMKKKESLWFGAPSSPSSSPGLRGEGGIDEPLTNEERSLIENYVEVLQKRVESRGGKPVESPSSSPTLPTLDSSQPSQAGVSTSS